MPAKSPERVAIPLTLSIPTMRQTEWPDPPNCWFRPWAQWSVEFVEPTPTGALRAFCRIALDRVIAQMSRWEPTSELSRFNSSVAA